MFYFGFEKSLHNNKFLKIDSLPCLDFTLRRVCDDTLDILNDEINIHVRIWMGSDYAIVLYAILENANLSTAYIDLDSYIMGIISRKYLSSTITDVAWLKTDSSGIYNKFILNYGKKNQSVVSNKIFLEDVEKAIGEPLELYMPQAYNKENIAKWKRCHESVQFVLPLLDLLNKIQEFILFEEVSSSSDFFDLALLGKSILKILIEEIFLYSFDNYHLIQEQLFINNFVNFERKSFVEIDPSKFVMATKPMAYVFNSVEAEALYRLKKLETIINNTGDIATIFVNQKNNILHKCDLWLKSISQQSDLYCAIVNLRKIFYIFVLLPEDIL